MSAKISWKLALGLLLIGLNACQSGGVTPVLNEGFPIQVWVDAPMDGSHLPLAPYIVVVSGSSLEGHVEQFEILINGELVFTLNPQYFSGEGSSQYAYSAFEWQPAEIGEYEIAARGLVGGAQSELAIAIVTVGDRIAIIEAEAREDSPIDDEALTPTPEGEHFLYAIPLQNANCRLGCSSEYFDIVDTLFEGEMYMPLSGGDGWLLFRGPVAERRCWASASLFDLQYGGESVSVEDANTMSLFAEGPSCPLNPTATFTPDSEDVLVPTETVGPPLPECSDGIDNDGDGDIDMADGRCTSPSDNSESS